jgi:hypothetical protein
MLRAEARRLREAFGALLLLLGACSTSQGSSTDAGKCDPGAPRPNPEDEAGCAYFVDFPCGPPKPTYDGCLLFIVDCADVCTSDAGFSQCEYAEGAGCSDGGLAADSGQSVTIECEICSGPSGRRTAGLRRPARTKAASVLGEYFADAAFLEAASVPAFERLARELGVHGAPAELVRAAERSARDEVRHARTAARLARRYGAEPGVAHVTNARPRGLEAVARENAVEGCVRETFGAMLATWQAANAKDPAVRRSMARIASDETRHAALAWAVARWADARLDARARGRVRLARRAAARALERELAREPPEVLVREAGVPRARVARLLARGLATHACVAREGR